MAPKGPTKVTSPKLNGKDVVMATLDLGAETMPSR